VQFELAGIDLGEIKDVINNVSVVRCR